MPKSRNHQRKKKTFQNTPLRPNQCQPSLPRPPEVPVNIDDSLPGSNGMYCVVFLCY